MASTAGSGSPSNRERSQQTFELDVLVLQTLQPSGIRNIHATELRFPFEKRLLRDPMFTANLNRFHASFRFPQQPNNLFFAKPVLLHRSLLSQDQILLIFGSVGMAQIKLDRWNCTSPMLSFEHAPCNLEIDFDETLELSRLQD